MLLYLGSSIAMKSAKVIAPLFSKRIEPFISITSETVEVESICPILIWSLAEPAGNFPPPQCFVNVAFMQIAEIFYSVQGEGRLVGMPSVFIRTSGCNLRCVWCDTPYTSWAPEGEKWSVREILGEVAKYPSRHIVVTGGEPLLAAEIEELTARVKTLGSSHYD